MAATAATSLARRVPPWRQKADALWRWWAGEISQMLPDRITRGSRVPVLALEDGDVVLVEPRSAAGPQARVAAATLDAALAQTAVRALLERAGETRARARLCLARDQALVRRVTLPAATEENLAQVIAFEMDRLTPFRADEVYSDQRVVSRDPASGQVGVEVAVAQREIVDAATARLRDLGISVQGVCVRGGAGQGAAALDLLPSDQRGERESANERMARNSLGVVVVLLLVAAMVLPAWQKREAIIALHPAIAKAKQDAESTDALARKLERQVADYNFMQAKRHAPLALAYIEDLSRLLPDNTWVQQFDLKTSGKNREVQISGESASASKLIELLEQSTLLQNAAPRGPFTRGSQPGTERFLIAAETRIKLPPEALPARDVVLLPPAAAVPVPAAQLPPAANTSALTEAPSEAAEAPAEGAADPPAKSDSVAAPPAPAPAKVQPLARPHAAQLSPEVRAKEEERAQRLRELAQERQKAAEEVRRERRQSGSEIK